MLFFKLVLLLVFVRGSRCLKNVQLKAVEAIRAGESLYLECDYDLEDALLYSIKWYFGDNEFYRFVPKESPPTRVFPLAGIIVDISKSNDRKVKLNDVQKGLTGYYKCEVSADAPLFHTDIKSALVIVTEQPKSKPILRTEKFKYSVGEYIHANCTSHKGFPASHVTWYINDVQVNDSYATKIWFTVRKEDDDMETTVSRLEIFATSKLFKDGKLRIKCIANQFNLYSQSSEIEIEDDTPQLAHVLSPSTTQNRGSSLRNFEIKTVCILLLPFTRLIQS